MKKHRLYLFLVFSMLLGCREAYDPTLEDKATSYLVVEGMINANGVTTIELGRTIRLSDKQVRQFETGAKVQIESDNNITYALTDKGSGIYTSGTHTLAADRKYRLRIKTISGKEYLSSFAEVHVTQPVTASWTQDANGVKVLASTSDPTKQALYYQWVAEETWEIVPVHVSYFYVVRTTAANISVRHRLAADILAGRQCWTTVRPPNILTASAANTNNGTISGFTLVDIPNGSDRLATRYSLLVTQYAISKDAYDFFEVMKKNTESMGSLFDPNPSLVRGNITCTTDPDEIVIGFVDCSISATHRIFITSQQANNWKSSRVCQTKFLQNNPAEIRAAFANDGMGVADSVMSDDGMVKLGYNIAKAECVDCRVLGTTVKPSFW